jgi:predicted RNA-binding protein with PIN domain
MPRDEADARTPESDVLHALPSGLWGPLLRAVRRAVDDVGRGRVPVGLRPFAGWNPEHLRTPRALRAVAEALVADPALRERVAARIEPPSAAEEAEQADPDELAERYGPDVAVAGFVATGRWDAVSVLAKREEQRAADARAARPARRSGDSDSGVVDGGGGERTGSVDGLQPRDNREPTARDGTPHEERGRESRRLRANLDRQRKRAALAEERAARAERRADALQAELADAKAGVERLSAELATQRRRDRSRIARLKEQLRRASAQPRIDATEAERVADELERLAGALRPEPRTAVDVPEDTPSAPVPREPPPATSGRPCVMPAGLSIADDAGVRSLLRAPGLRLFVDGYNVSLGDRGHRDQPLTAQRLWLTRLTASVAARFGCRTTVVFDGRDQEPFPGVVSPRGVIVVFTDEDETADDRIVRFVEGLDATAPAAVVTSDLELRSRVLALDANVVRSDAFLRAVSG